MHDAGLGFRMIDAKPDMSGLAFGSGTVARSPACASRTVCRPRNVTRKGDVRLDANKGSPTRCQIGLSVACAGKDASMPFDRQAACRPAHSPATVRHGEEYSLRALQMRPLDHTFRVPYAARRRRAPRLHGNMHERCPAIRHGGIAAGAKTPEIFFTFLGPHVPPCGDRRMKRRIRHRNCGLRKPPPVPCLQG